MKMLSVQLALIAFCLCSVKNCIGVTYADAMNVILLQHEIHKCLIGNDCRSIINDKIFTFILLLELEVQ